jgi:formate dehydrogenase iron-sulfur subunit
MTEKVQLIDVSKCIGCRSCQVACKQWNKLPAASTMNSGTYQNPPDLQANTWTLVRFQEVSQKEGGVKWLFWKDGCMHCTDATCVKLCPAGALFHLDYGAVGTDDGKCIGCQSCVAACPFSKPRYSKESNKAHKCDLCADRVQNDMDPACVKACPTGALKFGEKGEMLKLAHSRVKELGGEASVYGDNFFGGTHVVYVLEEKVSFYNSLPAKPKVAGSVIFWKDLFNPFAKLEAGIGFALVAMASFSKRKTAVSESHPPDSDEK